MGRRRYIGLLHCFPILLWSNKWKVRLEKAQPHEKRFVALGQVMQPCDCVRGHLAVRQVVVALDGEVKKVL